MRKPKDKPTIQLKQEIFLSALVASPHPRYSTHFWLSSTQNARKGFLMEHRVDDPTLEAAERDEAPQQKTPLPCTVLLLVPISV